MIVVPGRTNPCRMSTAIGRGLARLPSRMCVVVGEGIGPGRSVRRPPSCGVQADVNENRARSQRQVGDTQPQPEHIADGNESTAFDCSRLGCAPAQPDGWGGDAVVVFGSSSTASCKNRDEMVDVAPPAP